MLNFSSLTRTRRPLVRLKVAQLRMVGAAFALSAGLVACGNTATTPPSTNTGMYPVKVNFSGISGTQKIVVTYPDKSTGTFTLVSGGLLSLPAGTYTITPPTVTGKTAPAAQTVTVGTTNTSQTVTFTY